VPDQGLRREEIGPNEYATLVHDEIYHHKSRGFLEDEMFGRCATRHVPVSREQKSCAYIGMPGEGHLSIGVVKMRTCAVWPGLRLEGR
jgi:hypothetical protein